MVRLKAIFIYISIHSIKISIPYGAIKRILISIVIILITIFQFLMVRLKEMLELDLTKLDDLFQFLMVRLKEF